MEIITATEKHIPEIVELWKELVDFHKNIDPHFPVRKEAYSEWEKQLAELLKSEDTRVFVALYNGHAVGYSICKINKYPPYYDRETYGFIPEMTVTSSYRRKGVGEQMLAEICKWFKSQKIDRIELNMYVGNQVGLPFWQKHGFTIDSHWMVMDLK